MSAPKHAPELRRSIRNKYQQTTTRSSKPFITPAKRLFQDNIEQDLTTISPFENETSQALPETQSADSEAQRVALTLEEFDQTVLSFKDNLVREQIRDALKDYFAYLRQYVENFPKNDFYASNAYYQEGLKWTTNQIGVLAQLTKAFMTGLQNKVQEDSDTPRGRVARWLVLWYRRFAEFSDHQRQDFDILHHELMLQAAAENPRFQFLTAQNLVGAETHGAAEGSISVLSIGTFDTPKGRKSGYTKEDIGKTSEPGEETGIGLENAKGCMRSVATYEVCDLIGLDVIPYTALTKQKDADSKKEKIGQFMEKASGTTGQGKAIIAQIPDDWVEEARDLLQEFKLPQTASSRRKELRKDIEYRLNAPEGLMERNGRIYSLHLAAADIDWENPRLQQQLNSLHCLDLIIGHADRHAGNYIIDSDLHNRQIITGVKGIDNNDTWGGNYTSIHFGTDKSKTPDLPPVVDLMTAQRLLNTPWAAIEAILQKYGMTDKEIAAAGNRFFKVLNHVLELVQSNRIATLSGSADNADLLTLQQTLDARHGIKIQTVNQDLLQWGVQTARLSDHTNSYCGLQKALRQDDMDTGKPLYQPEW